jgi:hypothetical protein
MAVGGPNVLYFQDAMGLARRLLTPGIEEENMTKKLLAVLFLAGTSLFAGPRFSIGIGIGGPAYGYRYYPPPPPPPVYGYAAPVYARPGYTWVGGYWYPAGPRYAWRPGYWARPPYAGARWFAPRHHRGRYYNGHWGR